MSVVEGNKDIKYERIHILFEALNARNQLLGGHLKINVSQETSQEENGLFEQNKLEAHFAKGMLAQEITRFSVRVKRLAASASDAR